MKPKKPKIPPCEKTISKEHIFERKPEETIIRGIGIVKHQSFPICKACGLINDTISSEEYDKQK